MKTKIFRIHRKKRIRKKISGTSQKPRISVFRSNKHIYAQAIDDLKGKTLASVQDVKEKASIKPIESAKNTGKTLGTTLKKLKIENVVFDRGGYKYHGRVKAFAEGLREAGISL